MIGVEGEGSPAKLAGFLVVPQERVVPADGVEQFGLACLVADAFEQAGGLFGVAERLGVLPLVFDDRARRTGQQAQALSRRLASEDGAAPVISMLHRLADS